MFQETDGKSTSASHDFAGAGWTFADVGGLPFSTGEKTMQLKTIALATAFALTSSLAFAQSSGPAAIGSDADIGNRALINRGPNPSISMDRGSSSNRSPDTTIGSAPSASKRHARRPEAS
jgi:hypothetical protein